MRCGDFYGGLPKFGITVDSSEKLLKPILLDQNKWLGSNKMTKWKNNPFTHHHYLCPTPLSSTTFNHYLHWRPNSLSPSPPSYNWRQCKIYKDLLQVLAAMLQLTTWITHSFLKWQYKGSGCSAAMLEVITGLNHPVSPINLN